MTGSAIVVAEVRRGAAELPAGAWGRSVTFLESRGDFDRHSGATRSPPGLDYLDSLGMAEPLWPPSRTPVQHVPLAHAPRLPTR